jgi:Defence against restriction A N-terminal
MRAMHNESTQEIHMFQFAGFATLKSTSPEIKALTKDFARVGAVVVSTAVDAQATKKAGIPTKAITLSFADSQQIGILIKETGDAYGATMNGKAIPIRHQDDRKAGIAEIAAKLKANSAKFQKTLLAKAGNSVVVPASVRVSRVKMVDVLTHKRDTLVEVVGGKRDRLAELAN